MVNARVKHNHIIYVEKSFAIFVHISFNFYFFDGLLKIAILFAGFFFSFHKNVPHKIFIKLNNKIRIVHVSWNALGTLATGNGFCAFEIKAFFPPSVYTAYGIVRRNDSFFVAGLAHWNIAVQFPWISWWNLFFIRMLEWKKIVTHLVAWDNTKKNSITYNGTEFSIRASHHSHV